MLISTNRGDVFLVIFVCSFKHTRFRTKVTRVQASDQISMWCRERDSDSGQPSPCRSGAESHEDISMVCREEASRSNVSMPEGHASSRGDQILVRGRSVPPRQVNRTIQCSGPRPGNLGVSIHLKSSGHGRGYVDQTFCSTWDRESGDDESCESVGLYQSKCCAMGAASYI